MVSTIEKVLRRYGTSLILCRGDSEEIFRGFLQHSDSRSRQNMLKEFCPLGEIPRGQYILLAPLELELKTDDTLIQGTNKVTICRIETVMYGDRPAYRWGLCKEKGDEDLWGSQS